MPTASGALSPAPATGAARQTHVMTWVILLVALVGLVLVAVAAVRLSRHGVARVTSPRQVDEVLFGTDAEDLEQLFSAVDAEGVRARRTLVAARLEHLRSHRVPLRQVHASPVPTVARLGFADGSVLLARSVTSGDLVIAARLQRQGGLVIAELSDHEQGVAIVLASADGGGRCTLVVLGLDQPD